MSNDQLVYGSRNRVIFIEKSTNIFSLIYGVNFSYVLPAWILTMAAKVSVGEEASISTPVRPVKKEAPKGKRIATMEEGFQKVIIVPRSKLYS